MANSTEALDICLSGTCASNLTSACIDSCLSTAGYEVTANDSGTGIPIGASIAIAIVLICFSAMFSGLTLGLLSLDMVALKVLEKAGEPDERKYAKAIIPIRRNGNLLLCTLILGNTLVNNGVSILLADLTSGLVGLVASVLLVMIFGEITPQAICNRHGLYVGAHTIWIVKFFRLLFLPICWPMSWVLNKVLGVDIGTVYSQEEIKRLIELHATDPEAMEESGLTAHDHRLMIGALDYKHKTVRDVMTTINNVFMLEKTVRLNFDVMLAIYKSGFTRIPIYSGVKSNIVGILYAKDLILVDPEDELEIATVMSFRKQQHGGHIYEDVKLEVCFHRFLEGRNHMLIAHKPPLIEGPLLQSPYHMSPVIESTEITGIITLEDVIQEIIQGEIMDETDVWKDVNRPENKARMGREQADLDAFLAMLDDRLKGREQLTPQEAQAVMAFLVANVEEFTKISKSEVALRGLLRSAMLIEYREEEESESPTGQAAAASHGEFGRSHSKHSERMGSSHPLMLYEKGQKSSHFVLILSGRVCIETGKEEFAFELGPWSILGNRALVDPEYVPDFDAVVIPPCRILRIERPSYLAALRATQLSVVLEGHTVRREIKGAHKSTSTPVLIKQELPQAHGRGERTVSRSSGDLVAIDIPHGDQTSIDDQKKSL